MAQAKEKIKESTLLVIYAAVMVLVIIITIFTT
jgi:preprotein translocase subunit Sec61beta